MDRCEYCLEYKREENSRQTRAEPNKKVLFPNGQKLIWSLVCWDCIKERNKWDAQREMEKFQESERRRQWHKEVFERRERQHAEALDRAAKREASRQIRAANEYETDMTKLANLEAQIALCQRSAEAIRKKYFQNDDKNT